MDLKSLLSDNQKAEQKAAEQAPTLSKRPSSIDLLVNDTDASIHDHLTQSPVLSQKGTPSSRSMPTIKERSSISSLTNETDVDIDGKETPSVMRRLSYDTSENNSPILSKKNIPRPTPLNHSGDEPVMEHKEETGTKNPQKAHQNETQLKAKQKPKRYSKPPIWASKWRNSKQRDFSTNGDSNDPSSGRVRSINDIKPYNDFNRRISNWLYSHIESIPAEHRKFLELEVRFGQIWDRRTDRRIHLPVVSECILDKDYVTNKCHFKSGLELSSFNQMNKSLTDLVKRYPKSFKTMMIDQVDKQFREASRGQIPKKFRISYDRKTNRVMENIEKRKIDSLFVHTGDLKLDYRLSLSLEMISNENPARFDNKTPEVERYKLRTSIIHDKTSTRFDLTKVKQSSKIRNSADTDDVEHLEVELEIDMPKLIHAFDTLDKDSFSFEDMSETLLDNARILNRKLE